jgi:hypothetical protein
LQKPNPSKQENTQLCFVIFAKCCCCSLQKKKSKSKQARKHTIVLCEIGKVLLFVVAHFKNQIQIQEAKQA